MQFIERNMFDVRAAVYRLNHPAAKLKFLLCPMIHLGSASYYAEIAARLKESDAILFEGVRSAKGRFIIRSYEMIAKKRGLGLVLQRDALPLKQFSGKLVNADLDAQGFSRSWDSLPLRDRLLLNVAAPLYGLYLRFTATRGHIASHLQIEDLPARHEILKHELGERVDQIIVDRRDRALSEIISGYFSDHSNELSTVGIVWGAGHMRAIVRLLLGYRIAQAEWVTVFPLVEAGHDLSRGQRPPNRGVA